jgi:hypothetical protein
MFGNPSNRLRLAGVLFAIPFFLFLVLSASADAARVHPLIQSEPLPEGKRAYALVVDQSTGHYYVVADAGNKASRDILNFEANGELDPSHPELTGVPEPHFYLSVAVDNSNGSRAGYIYASSLSNLTVQQFAPDGKATAVTISQASIPPNGTPQGGGLPPVVNLGGFAPRAVAVGPTGNVYVNDTREEPPRSELIDEFSSSGAFVAQFVPEKRVDATGMAISPSGDIYLTSDTSGGGARVPVGLVKLTSSGQCTPPGCNDALDPKPAESVAFAAAAENIFTATKGAEPDFREFDATDGQLLGITSSTHFHLLSGIGIDEASGRIIVTDSSGQGESTIQIYGPVEIVPDVEVLPPTEITLNSATLNGEIGAAEVPGATCAFQYVTAEAFASKRFEGAAEAPCEPEGPFSGAAKSAVSAHVHGLTGGTTYKFRLVGQNENGSNPTEGQEFTTKGPTVSGIAASEASETAVTLGGSVDPRGSATTYAFQYVTQAAFDAAGFANAVEVPAGGGALGAGSGSVSVAQRLEGLTPGTAYRFRLVAVNAEGETQGPDIPFTTFGRRESGLPDGRRYEQVSPIDKNGSNVQGAVNSVRASLEGGAVTFFTNTGIPGGEGSQDFPTYLARRAAAGTGWSTQGLFPSPKSYGPAAAILGWSEDLKDVYEASASPFEPGQLLLRSSSDGSIARFGSFQAGIPPITFSYSGGSADDQVALLESHTGSVLPEDAVGKQNLYAYDRKSGALVLAGVLNPVVPGGQPVVPADGAAAGPFGWFAGVGAEGGSQGRYFTQALHVISADGQRIFFTAEGTDQLYMRIHPFAPQSAMSGEHCTEATGACTIRISAPEGGVEDPGTAAAFVGASADGSLVFFLDRGKLTADATGGSGYDLYRYDVATGELSDLTQDAVDKQGARVEGLLGMSADGNAVYFAAAGKLADGTSEAPPGETNLYALEGGATRFIARLGTGVEESWNWIPMSLPGETGTVPRTSRVSADGGTALFLSHRQLTAYANDGVAELYLDRPGGITCVSCNPSGQAPLGPAGTQKIPPVGIRIIRLYVFMTRNLSADGRRVIFDSADKLVAADENDVNDVYEWEVPGKGSCTQGSSSYSVQDGGCLYLLSGGAKGVGGSYFGDADGEGEDAFIFTAQPLVAQDKDELVDVYDAKVDGGIASQEAEPAPGCEAAEACRNAMGPPSVLPSPASSSFVGPGNKPKPKVVCRKGTVKRRGKCVARNGKKHGRHRRDHHRKHQTKGHRAKKGRNR